MESKRSPRADHEFAASRPNLERAQHYGDDCNIDEDAQELPRPAKQHQKMTPASAKEAQRSKEPAYVGPITKIAKIPPISQETLSSADRPKLSTAIGTYLLDRCVDQSGNLVDDQSGTVLARVGGDLPSMVGRKVSNRDGDILGDDGELLGWVADVWVEEKKASVSGSGQNTSARRRPGARSLSELMRHTSSSLLVDHIGNILDCDGKIVGKFHDNNNPLRKKQGGERRRRESQSIEEAGKEENKRPEANEAEEPQGPQQESGSEQEPDLKDGRTEAERRQNAEAWRKENPGESPSDIFLDVKSTTEGIQLTIRIPTVFGNGHPVKSNITFS